MATQADNRLMRKREAAAYIAVSERTIDTMLARRELTPIRFGRAVRIDRGELDAKIAAARK